MPVIKKVGNNRLSKEVTSAEIATPSTLNLQQQIDNKVNVVDAGTVYLAPDGNGSGLTGIFAPDITTNVTAATTNLTVAQCTGRVTITNYGSSVTNECVLPAAAANLRINLLVVTGTAGSIGIKITPGAGDALIIGGTTIADATGLTSYIKGSEWEAIAVQTGASAYDWMLKLKGVQPQITVVKNATQENLASGAPTLVTWQTETIDNNDNFASNTATPTIPGRYLIKVLLCINGLPLDTTNRVGLWLYKGGSFFQGVSNQYRLTAYDNEVLLLSWEDNLNGSNAYTVYAVTDGGTADVLQTNADGLVTSFMITRMSD